ncbi:hypothetical protein BJX61DRAFT_539340 [Aspergillus egyptiacus]|nr:hypothetical protein BJX61DRAFT_539340 [Aspergillus egyptiacus]
MPADLPRVKTCQTCATAKIRCLCSPDSPICDRRLGLLERRVDELLGQSSQGHSPPDGKTGDVIDKGILSLDDAAALLDSFRHCMMPHFPFVVLPMMATAGELRESAPFLFLAILSVSATHDRALKRGLDEEMRAVLAERTVLKHNHADSLDTLQGLLVVLAWSQHELQQRSAPRHFSTYLYLALSLVVDRRLDKPIETWRRKARRMNIREEAIKERPLKTVRAEQRAALGCSFLSSCSGIITQERCLFPWTPELEASAVALAEHPEYDSDQIILHLVRLQHVLEEIDQVSSDHDSFAPSGCAFHHIFRSFTSRIQNYSSLLPPELTNNFLLATQFHTASLYLCQVSLFDRSKATTQLPVEMRSEILCQGLVAAKSSFASLATTGVGFERHFSYSQWLQSGFNLIVSCKLALMAVSDTTLRDHCPQVQTLCDALDMPGVLSMCIAFQDHHPAGSDPATGFDYKAWLKLIQEWFLRQYDGYVARQGASAPASSTLVSSQTYLRIGDGSTGDLQQPLSSHSMEWSSFGDLVTSNPLAEWMDLSMLSCGDTPGA